MRGLSYGRVGAATGGGAPARRKAGRSAITLTTLTSDSTAAP